MASSATFEVGDQIDEDSFDKLVDDEFSVEGTAASKDMVRDFSNASLCDFGTSVEDTGNDRGNDDEMDGKLSSSGVQKADLLPSVAGMPRTLSADQISLGNVEEFAPEGSRISMSEGKKGKGVKKVQWSSFDAGSVQIGNGEFGSYSDVFSQNSFGGSDLLHSKENAEFGFVDDQSKNIKTDTISSEFDDISNDSPNVQNADVNYPQYWENLYPGWKYDSATGQWYQVDAYEASFSNQYGSNSATVEDIQVAFEVKSQVAADSDLGNSGMIYLQRASQPMLETIQEDNALTNVSDWNMVSQSNTEHPPNMVFSPEYPGWYYDTNDMQWHSLESYTQTIQMASNEVQHQMLQDKNTSAGFTEQSYIYKVKTVAPGQSSARGQGTQDLSREWNTSTSNYSQENVWQPTQSQDQFNGGFPVMLQPGKFHGSMTYGANSNGQHISHKGFEPATSHKFDISTNVVRSHNFFPGERTCQFNQMKMEKSLHSSLSSSYYGDQNPLDFSQQSFRGSGTSFSHLSNTRAGRSSAGRPAHALVKFGFGGQLIVMKNTSFGMTLGSGIQGSTGASISVLNLSDVVKDKYNASSMDSGPDLSYFHSLFQQVLPGPLVGGSTATKDVNKWLDEIVTSLDSAVNYQRAKLLKLLLSLLKLSCLHYGKLRSPFGSDPSVEGTDGPEMAVANLFASVRRNSSTSGNYGTVSHCLQNIHPEGQIRATAIAVQNLLVIGRKKEALQYAQDGQLWGPALVLAAQLGDQFYIDTVKKMAHSQFISASPLRTLCLLIAGQPADVFSASDSTVSGSFVAQATQVDGNSMLSSWEENLAIMAANRTKDDHLVIIHLGDCLWKEKGEVVAAHTCYLVAEANFELYSDSARLCLIGADHLKYPRTYASPFAIQRTEVYEYSKVLGNSQFILQPFQPYKLIYAYMLAEVGKVSESMRYCQASLKLLKNSERAPEVEMLRTLLSSLEERLRTHQQGGYGTNLAPAKLVGKLFTSIDRSIHRMMGTPSAALPPVPQSSVSDKEVSHVAPKVINSLSTMDMSSLVPSASVEAMSEWTGDGGRKAGHNRSISEPDFSRTPKQDGVSDGSSKESMVGASRLGRFGFGSGILQKTIGWVSRSNRQAKLGESNKFYYDEKLKRWVEKGAAPPSEEAALPPPPKAATFQNGMPDYSISNGFNGESHRKTEMSEAKSSGLPEHSSGIPPIPSYQNQFSAHGRVGVRSRYVDTFNKGSAASTASFQATTVQSAKPIVGSKFFVPSTPVTLDKQRTDDITDNSQGSIINKEPSTSAPNDESFSSSASSSTLIQHFPSMDNLTPNGNNSSVVPSWGSNRTHSRSRAASWGGTYPDAFKPPSLTEPRPVNGRRRSLSNENNVLTSFMPTSFGDSSSGSWPLHNGG